MTTSLRPLRSEARTYTVWPHQETQRPGSQNRNVHQLCRITLMRISRSTYSRWQQYNWAIPVMLCILRAAAPSTILIQLLLISTSCLSTMRGNRTTTVGLVSGGWCPHPHHNCLEIVSMRVASTFSSPVLCSSSFGHEDGSTKLDIMFLGLSLYNNLTDLFIQEIGKSLFQLYQIYGISEQSQPLAVHSLGSQGNGVVACQ